MPIRITSEFRPLTYDEISKPLIQATQAQMEVEDAYVEASNKAAEIMAKANQQTDPIAYNRLKNYADDLKYQADQLASQGLQSGSRRALLDMKRRYGTDITPIEQAATRKKELSDELRKLRVQNPNLIVQRDIDTTSLDEFINNPDITYGATINTTDVRTRAKAITEAIGAYESSINYGTSLDSRTKELIKSIGISPDDILNNRNEALKKALEKLYVSTGVSEFNTQAQQQVENAIFEGSMLGAGKTDKTTAKDPQQELTDSMLRSGYQPDGNGGWKSIKPTSKYRTNDEGYLLGEDGEVYKDTEGNKYRVSGNTVYKENKTTGALTKITASSTSGGTTWGSKDNQYTMSDGEHVMIIDNRTERDKRSPNNSGDDKIIIKYEDGTIVPDDKRGQYFKEIYKREPRANGANASQKEQK